MMNVPVLTKILLSTISSHLTYRITLTTSLTVEIHLRSREISEVVGISSELEIGAKTTLTYYWLSLRHTSIMKLAKSFHLAIRFGC